MTENKNGKGNLVDKNAFKTPERLSNMARQSSENVQNECDEGWQGTGNSSVLRAKSIVEVGSPDSEFMNSSLGKNQYQSNYSDGKSIQNPERPTQKQKVSRLHQKCTLKVTYDQFDEQNNNDNIKRLYQTRINVPLVQKVNWKRNTISTTQKSNQKNTLHSKNNNRFNSANQNDLDSFESHVQDDMSYRNQNSPKPSYKFKRRQNGQQNDQIDSVVQLQKLEVEIELENQTEWKFNQNRSDHQKQKKVPQPSQEYQPQQSEGNVEQNSDRADIAEENLSDLNDKPAINFLEQYSQKINGSFSTKEDQDAAVGAYQNDSSSEMDQADQILESIVTLKQKLRDLKITEQNNEKVQAIICMMNELESDKLELQTQLNEVEFHRQLEQLEQKSDWENLNLLFMVGMSYEYPEDKRHDFDTTIRELQYVLSMQQSGFKMKMMQLNRLYLSDAIQNINVDYLILHSHMFEIQDSLNLVFEHPNGKKDEVSIEDFGDIIDRANTKPKVVFLMACQSEQFGYLMHQKGYDHVICIKQDTKILEEAARTFLINFFQSKLLYEQSQGDNNSSGHSLNNSACKDACAICASFQEAKGALGGINPDEQVRNQHDGILLLTQGMESALDEDNQLDQELCFENYQLNIDNEFQCGTRPVLQSGKGDAILYRPHFNRYKQLNLPITNNTSLLKQVGEVVKMVTQTNIRTIEINGSASIGKTLLSNQVMQYCQSRLLFNDGIIHVQLRNRGNGEKDLIDQLMEYVKLRPNNSYNEQYDSLWQAFLWHISKKEVLIVIDLAEDWTYLQEHANSKLDANVLADINDNYQNMLDQVEEIKFLIQKVVYPGNDDSEGAPMDYQYGSSQHKQELDHSKVKFIVVSRNSYLSQTDLSRLFTVSPLDLEESIRLFQSKVKFYTNGQYVLEFDRLKKNHNKMFNEMHGNPRTIDSVARICRDKHCDMTRVEQTLQKHKQLLDKDHPEAFLIKQLRKTFVDLQQNTEQMKLFVIIGIMERVVTEHEIESMGLLRQEYIEGLISRQMIEQVDQEGMQFQLPSFVSLRLILQDKPIQIEILKFYFNWLLKKFNLNKIRNSDLAVQVHVADVKLLLQKILNVNTNDYQGSMQTGSINFEHSVKFNNSNFDRQSCQRARRDSIKQWIPEKDQIPELPEEQDEMQDIIMPLDDTVNRKPLLPQKLRKKTAPAGPQKFSFGQQKETPGGFGFPNVQNQASNYSNNSQCQPLFREVPIHWTKSLIISVISCYAKANKVKQAYSWLDTYQQHFQNMNMQVTVSTIKKQRKLTQQGYYKNISSGAFDQSSNITPRCNQRFSNISSGLNNFRGDPKTNSEPGSIDVHEYLLNVLYWKLRAVVEMLMIEQNGRQTVALQRFGDRIIREDIRKNVWMFTKDSQFKRSKEFYLSFLMARIVLLAKQFIRGKPRLDKQSWQFPQNLIQDMNHAKDVLREQTGQATQTEIEMCISFLDNLKNSREITISKKNYLRILMLQLDGIELE